MKTKKSIAMILALAIIMTTAFQGTELVQAQEQENTIGTDVSTEGNLDVSKKLENQWNDGYVAKGQFADDEAFTGTKLSNDDFAKFSQEFNNSLKEDGIDTFDAEDGARSIKSYSEYRR